MVLEIGQVTLCVPCVDSRSWRSFWSLEIFQFTFYRFQGMVAISVIWTGPFLQFAESMALQLSLRFGQVIFCIFQGLVVISGVWGQSRVWWSFLMPGDCPGFSSGHFWDLGIAQLIFFYTFLQIPGHFDQLWSLALLVNSSEERALEIQKTVYQ